MWPEAAPSAMWAYYVPMSDQALTDTTSETARHMEHHLFVAAVGLLVTTTKG